MSKPILGMLQEVEYESSAARLYGWIIDDFGRPAEPDSTPQITVYEVGGDELVSATNMTAYAGTDSGFLNYDAQTAEFEIGTTLTGGTSTATGLIVGQTKSGATGTLELTDISGTFQNNETITDSESGSATADGTLWQNLYYYDLDASSTSDYEIDRNYSFKVTYAISSRSYVERYYFDVVFYPANRPFITTSQVTAEFPELIGRCPDEWTDWSYAIKSAHRKLCRQIKALGEAASYFLKRREELAHIELAYTRLKIATAIGEPEERIEFWQHEAESAWESKGELTYDADQEDSEIDEDVKVITSRLTR